MDAFICALEHLGWNGRLSALGRGSCCDLISCGSSRGMMSSSFDLESTTVRCSPPPPDHHHPPTPWVSLSSLFLFCSSPSLTPYEFLSSLSQLLTQQKTSSPCRPAQAFINSAFLSSCYFSFIWMFLCITPSALTCQKKGGSVFEGQKFTSLIGQIWSGWVREG